MRHILEMPSAMLVQIMDEANAAGRRAVVANKLVALLSQRIADLEAERARRAGQHLALADYAQDRIEWLEAALTYVLNAEGKGENDMRDGNEPGTKPLH